MSWLSDFVTENYEAGLGQEGQGPKLSAFGRAILEKAADTAARILDTEDAMGSCCCDSCSEAKAAVKAIRALMVDP